MARRPLRAPGAASRAPRGSLRTQPRQLALELPEPPPPRPGRGGARAGAGRKPRPENARRALTKHLTRPAHAARHPVHVTLRAHGGLPSLRHQALQRVLERSLARVASLDFQVVHYALQRDHVHLVVEARDRDALSTGMRRLVIGLALRLNQALGRGRRGKVWGDRWHRHDLRSPREARNALVYVFGNARRHGVASARRALDRFSSAAQFGGWLATRAAPDVGLASRAAPRAPDVDAAPRRAHAPHGASPHPASPPAPPPWASPRPRTWLLREGYVRGGGPVLVDDVVASL